MKLYKFPSPDKVEDVKHETRKRSTPPDNALKNRIAELSAKVSFVFARVEFIRRNADLIGPKAEDELWRLQRDMEYYAAKLYEARKQQESR
jgi:hypothetical protein